MKRVILFAALYIALSLAFAACACAQTITMEDIYAQIDFPDTWLVLSPQLLRVYEPLLSQHGFDVNGMAERYESEGVIAEAWDADFAQSMRVMVTRDERAQTLFTLDRSTTAERNSMAKYYQTASNFSSTPYRFKQVEWQKHSQYGRFLFLRYNVVDEDGDITERGVRYITIQNGMNYIIDWTIPDRRFTNNDLSRFKALLETFAFTAALEAPPLPAQLSADIPAEVSSAHVELSGTASSSASIYVTLSDGESASEVISVGMADANGSFSIFFDLPAEGSYTVILTAKKDGYADTSIRQTLVYEGSLLPVSIDAWPADPWTEDTFTLTGTTLPGSELQLVTDIGLVKKKPNADGSFKFELNTPEAKTYNYTLIVNNGKYTQRRFPFTINRVYTQSQELSRIKKSAVSISYRNLQTKADQYLGQVMRLSGYVSEITQGEGVTFVRLMLSRNTKGVWTTPVIIACEEAPELTEGERAVIYGYVASPYYEQSGEESNVAVPGFTFICAE